MTSHEAETRAKDGYNSQFKELDCPANAAAHSQNKDAMDLGNGCDPLPIDIRAEGESPVAPSPLVASGNKCVPGKDFFVYK